MDFWQGFGWLVGVLLTVVVPLVLSIVACMYPEFRFWLLPKIGLRPDVFQPVMQPQTRTTTTLPLIINAFGQGETPLLQRQLGRIICPLCQGRCVEWGRYEETCHKCDGRGTLYTYRKGQPKCRQCNGTGRKNARYEADCPICDAVGLLPYEVSDQDHMIAQPPAAAAKAI
jgi:hypothetical protein